MRVIFVTRPDAGRLFGGDLVHAEELARELRARGCEVTVASGPQSAETYGSFEVAHFFNLHTPEFTQPEMAKAKAAGVHCALSPIYWDARAEWLLAMSPRWGRLRSALGSSMALALARARIRATTGRWTALNRLALSVADVVMPSGDSEIGQLRRLRSDLPLLAVVPLGIRPEVFDPGVAWGFPKSLADRGIKRYLLVAARVDAHKNQRGLLAALEGTEIPVALAGEIIDDEIRRECERRGAILLGRVAREELLGLYAHARVHALPSFYDVPGLASLEAAAMGCAIVSTTHGTAHDYFGERAWYCDPSDLASIRQAVTGAWEAGPAPSLSAEVRERFTWANAARLTAEAYRTGLARRA